MRKVQVGAVVRRGALAAVWASLATSSAFAEDLFLADGQAFPGRLWLSEGGTAERAVHHREPRPNPAFPNAVTKLSQVAVGSDGKIFYVSGLDGCLMHLLDGRHEILSFEYAGQIRDLACTGEERVVYFSVVPTPQNGEPLADGAIFRRDLGEGAPTLVATVRQADVGGNWWGTFAIRNGEIVLATLDEPARLYKWTGSGVVRAFPNNRTAVRGFVAAGDGRFWIANGTGTVLRTRDFETFETGLTTDRRLTDVALRAPADAPRP